VARTGAKRNLDRFFVRKTEGETLLRRRRPGCVVNIEIEVKEKKK
jgi:riboflavin synthase alpha subunit